MALPTNAFPLTLSGAQPESFAPICQCAPFFTSCMCCLPGEASVYLFKTGNHHQSLSLFCSHLSHDLLFYQMLHPHPTSNQNASSGICCFGHASSKFIWRKGIPISFFQPRFMSPPFRFYSCEISSWIFSNFCCYCKVFSPLHFLISYCCHTGHSRWIYICFITGHLNIF